MLANTSISTKFPSLDCTYSHDDTEKLLDRENVMAVIDFTGQCQQNKDPRHVSSGLKAIAPQDYKEVWTTTHPLTKGRSGNLSWVKTDEFCFLSYYIDGNENLQSTFTEVYHSLLSFLKTHDYPHIQRIWNYLSDINVGDGDEENYKQFCAGRHDAFAQADLPITQFPAACAIGQYTPNNVVYLLASKVEGTHFENPRQMSAYHYPRQYGVSSPSFARATLTSLPGQQQVFLSGTASVLGHETKHADDPDKQLTETTENIEALMHHVASQCNQSEAPEPVLLKVYLRHQELYRPCRQKLRESFGRVPILYLHGDICRQDLALEIDGLYKLR